MAKNEQSQDNARRERFRSLRRAVRAIESGQRRRAPRFTEIPILGRIPAGFGDATPPENLGTFPVDLDALDIREGGRTFALKVSGDSMINAQISDGDTVIVETREPKFGDIVAALIDGETTLKRFVAHEGGVYLKAENPKYPDLVPIRDLVIQGVVRAVFRVCDRRSDLR